MIMKNITWLLLILSFVIVDCENEGVCNTTRLVTTRMWEPYTRRRIETYKTFSGRCYPYGCTRTRWRIVNDERIVTKTKIGITQKCCLGYIETERNTDSIKCAPICIPACKNGYCRTPGECACNVGYVLDPHDSRNCLPSCPAGTCEHGTCIAPNTCQCDFGYTMQGTCRPICTTPCNNGNCLAPETCECLIGYRKSNNNVCEPYCSTGCENGTCVGPETCRCNSGFRKLGNNTTNQACSPVCLDPCENGTCVAPDTCQCLSGFEKSENGTCQPVCAEGCDNGTCVAPETCRCNPGWTNTTDVCEPVCSEGCDNGTCVAPETCRCNPGWTANTTNVCEPVCSDCGNGTCVAPDTCECFPGYAWNSTCTPKCSDGCDGGECVSPDVCQCETGWEYANGTCVPNCKDACRNGTGMETTETDSGNDNDDFSESTMLVMTDDGLFTFGSNGTLNDTDDAVTLTSTSEGTGELVSYWVQQHWMFIAFPVLLIVLIAVAALLAFRWRFLRHYLKGDSYTVQGNITEAHRTSSFVDVSFSALEKEVIMEAKY